MAHYQSSRSRMSRSTDRICLTRGIKNINYVRQSVPRYFKKKSLKEILNLSPTTLSNLQRISKPHEVIQNTELANFLEKNRIPIPAATVSTPLFNGTLVFVQIIFNRPSQPQFMMNTADIQTAINYSNLAIIPIHRYASQYGSNSINVSPNIIQFNVNLTGNTFNDEDLQGWVDTIATSNNLVNSCIMVLIDTTGPRNSDASGNVGGYHFITGNNVPYCCCNVFGHNLTIDDSNNDYALILSHEIAEMVVDPQGNLSNPEVCDACAGNCNNVQNDFFDNNNNFIGGSHVFPPPFGFKYFINSIIKPDFYNPSTECAIPGSDQQAVCIYAPPSVWNGPGTLTSVSNVRSVSGHFSNSDQRHIVIVGTASGKIHEIFWKPGQVGIEGEDDLPVSFSPGSIVSVAAFYNSNDQRHIVIVGTTGGKIHEIFWKSDTVGVEGHDDLPVSFSPGSIVSVAAFYNSNDQRHIVIVGTTGGKIHEIFWKSDTVGIEGEDDLPVSFSAGTIKSVAAFYNSNDQRHIVIVGTTDGKIHEIFWKSDTVGIEIHGTIAQFNANSIVRVAGFYSESDDIEHAIVCTTDGKVHELWVNEGV